MYQGVYKGQNVVIKIQKEGLKSKLFIDFLVVSIIARVVDAIYSPRQANIPQLIKDFKQATYNELDYLRGYELGDEIDMTDFFIEIMRMGEKFKLKLPERMFVFGRTSQISKSYNALSGTQRAVCKEGFSKNSKRA
ncbi:hypothetical protein COT50_03445 [candidate division WWE3 bacterium CG08_land_8_20_14_0_20_41_10]|uniref:ABC1 atypical kinase-like domain-containing protein n=1 Tax=candidate division WWE3 bacterium CG08_land_8_20_14_0_20_41_10 TaxID=1975085 RepID=A0A2H0XB70_UNCKA|nr:MAG: hypothetical protein COT50_03445 [candidate division WWE3 bacterium CG08_land_8_20_14_0_20_41_10]